MAKPMTREEVKKWAKEFVEEFNARQEEIAGCDCDSPTWCQQYGKCHRVSCGFAPAKKEWQGLTENEIKHLWYEACQTNLELTSQLIVHLARNIEAKLKEKNT